MRPESMDEWSAPDWSVHFDKFPERKERVAVESDDTRFAKAKDITPQTPEAEKG